MNPVTILLKAYYELLCELLDSSKTHLSERMEFFIRKEIGNLNPSNFDEEKYQAYHEAAIAFLAERMETYNPLGIQYTFDRIPEKLARQLEMQLNWYDSTEEFEALKRAAAEIAEPDMTDSRLRQLAEELIRMAGAFPDKSIISTYEAAPALLKLPDYVLAKAIEEIINQ